MSARLTDSQRSHGAINVARQQRERVKDTIHRLAPGLGLSARAIATALVWPLDSAEGWLRELLDLGEIRIRPGDEDVASPRYITTEDALAAASQADGVA